MRCHKPLNSNRNKIILQYTFRIVFFEFSMIKNQHFLKWLLYANVSTLSVVCFRKPIVYVNGIFVKTLLATQCIIYWITKQRYENLKTRYRCIFVISSIGVFFWRYCDFFFFFDCILENRFGKQAIVQNNVTSRLISYFVKK